jgi:hypothetical protein
LLSELERVEPEVRWRGSDRSVSYALFAKRGFSDKLRALAAERDDLSLWTVDDVVNLF